MIQRVEHLLLPRVLLPACRSLYQLHDIRSHHRFRYPIPPCQGRGRGRGGATAFIADLPPPPSIRPSLLRTPFEMFGVPHHSRTRLFSFLSVPDGGVRLGRSVRCGDMLRFPHVPPLVALLMQLRGILFGTFIPLRTGVLQRRQLRLARLQLRRKRRHRPFQMVHSPHELGFPLHMGFHHGGDHFQCHVMGWRSTTVPLLPFASHRRHVLLSLRHVLVRLPGSLAWGGAVRMTGGTVCELGLQCPPLEHGGILMLHTYALLNGRQ